MGSPLEQRTGPFGALADDGAGLVDAAVRAQEPEHLGQGGVVVQVGVQQLSEPLVAGIGRAAGQQGRQGRDPLPQIGAGRLSGLVAGDVDDVVTELEDDADLLTEGGKGRLRSRRSTPAIFAPKVAEVAMSDPVLSATTCR